eukprot:COSAG02_NODE_781_length_17261_cov_433.056054_16_plen_574_part_01
MPPAYVRDASAQILELLGDDERREEAYAALMEVADRKSCYTLPQPDTTVQVLGLDKDTDTDTVASLLGQFGEVVACTTLCAQKQRHRTSGSGDTRIEACALVTFGCAADAQKAAASKHVNAHAKDSGRLSTTGDAMSRHQAKVHQATAVQILLPCVVPLMEALHPDDSASISIAEFQRGSLVLASMVAVDLIVIGGKVCEEVRCFTLGSRPRSHFAAVFGKDTADLTADDALTVSCWTSAMGLAHCKLMECMKEGGTNEGEFLDAYAKTAYNTPEYRANFDHIVRLASLLLDLITFRGDVSAHTVTGGSLMLLHLHLIMCPDGRSPAKAAFEAGFVPVMVEAVQDYPAPQRIQIFNVGAARMWCLKDVVSSAQPEDAIRSVIDSRLIDIILENLAAIHAFGDVSQVCVMQYWYGCFYLLSSLDLRLPSAAPIIEKLRTAAADIKWCLANSVTHMEMFGWSVSAQGTLLAAAAFGRDEADGSFTFSSDNMTEVVRHMRDTMRPRVPVWPMKETQGLELLDLVISDANKSLLLATPHFIDQLEVAPIVDSRVVVLLDSLLSPGRISSPETVLHQVG